MLGQTCSLQVSVVNFARCLRAVGADLLRLTKLTTPGDRGRGPAENKARHTTFVARGEHEQLCVQ